MIILPEIGYVYDNAGDSFLEDNSGEESGTWGKKKKKASELYAIDTKFK